MESELSPKFAPFVGMVCASCLRPCPGLLAKDSVPRSTGPSSKPLHQRSLTFAPMQAGIASAMIFGCTPLLPSSLQPRDASMPIQQYASRSTNISTPSLRLGRCLRHREIRHWHRRRGNLPARSDHEGAHTVTATPAHPREGRKKEETHLN